MAIFDSDDPFQEHEAANYRNRENRGRRAGVYASFRTTGHGVLEFERRIDFGVLYIQEPWISYGCRIDLDGVRDALALEEDEPPALLPLCTGFVTEFDRDRADNYVGAWVAVNVQYPEGLSFDADITIHHYFTFEAIALKDVGF